MKKLLAFLVAAMTAATLTAGFTACTPEKSLESVNLVQIEASAVGIMEGVDYYVLPEPAASAQAKAKNLNIVGSLQELYGTEGGYPQAVMVAKNEIVENCGGFLQAFIAEINANKQWLADDSTSAQTVVEAVSSHLPDGTTPSFNANNLTKSVIENCGIGFSSAADCKQRVIDFINDVNTVASTDLSMSDSFFASSYGTGNTKRDISVYMPDGAPALALAKLMAEENSFGEYASSVTYNVVVAETIAQKVTGANPVADICILPSNLAAKQLGSGDVYRLVGTVTNGNLYILSALGEPLTRDNIASLAGKTVGVIQLDNVPGLTFKTVLYNNGLDFTTIA